MKKLSRTDARKQAYSLIFASAFQPTEAVRELYENGMESLEFTRDEFTEKIFFGVMQNLAVIDEKIESLSDGWKCARISPATLASLRLSAYELMFEPDVPTQVSINEALNLIADFGDEKTKPFANGILDKIAKEARKDA